MKVVIDARESGTSTGRYVDKLVEYVHTLDLSFEIILLAKPHRVSFFEELAPNFKVVESPYKEFTLSEQLGFLKQIKSLGADLVHFTMTQQPVLYRGLSVTTIHDLTAIRFRNPAKNPVVFTFKQQVFKWVIKRAAKKSARIITISEFVKKDIAEYAGVNPDKITVTYEAADRILADAEPVVGLERASFIMYVGRPTPHKNLKRLIQAFYLAQKTHQDLRLVLVGKTDDNYRRLQAWVDKKGISNVVFTDFATEGQLRWLYERARAYVFPSLSEGFGLPPLEAMIHGCPVISSNATCLPEINKNGALYFDPLDVNDIAEKIGGVLENPGIAERLAKEGKAVAAQYSWQRMAEQTLAVYQDALDRP